MSHPDDAPMLIGEAATRTGVTVECLRYYEAEGLVWPARDAGGRRVFSPADLDQLAVVHTLRSAGFGVAQIRRLIQVKPGHAPAERVRLAREVLMGFDAEVRQRRKELAAAQRLVRAWLADLDSTGL